MIKYKLFLDLDGVLADFDAGVLASCGKLPGELMPRVMWPILARTKDFYAKLPWMKDGKELWERCKPFDPVILTGIPLGQWAAPQKLSWCAKELGARIPVITCLSKEKGSAISNWLEEDETPILVDDRLKSQPSWLDIGGIFVLHSSAEDSLKQLNTWFPGI